MDEQRRAEAWDFVEDFLKRDLENTGFESLDELKQRIEEYWDHEESPLTFETLRSQERMGIIQGDGCRHSPSRFIAKDVAGIKRTTRGWNETDWPVRQLVRLDRLTVLQHRGWIFSSEAVPVSHN